MNTLSPRDDKGQPPQRPNLVFYFGLLPVLLGIVLVLCLWRFPPALNVYEPHFLLPALNTILFLTSTVIAFIAWRSYLFNGAATILWLGCGVLA